MKTRKGFVSNSSSSSFILNYKDSKPKFTVKDVEMKLSEVFDLYEKHFGKKIKRKEINTQEITGKEYKEKIKLKGYELEKWFIDELKDNRTYIEIYDDGDNSFPYVVIEWIEELFGAHRKHLG